MRLRLRAARFISFLQGKKLNNSAALIQALPKPVACPRAERHGAEASRDRHGGRYLRETRRPDQTPQAPPPQGKIDSLFQPRPLSRIPSRRWCG